MPEIAATKELAAPMAVEIIYAKPAYAELGTLVASGRLKWKAHVEDGLENAVEAVGRLFTGDHDGKLLVRVSP